MSAELLLNNSKTTKQASDTSGNSAKLNNKQDKKEGNSLFDSLMKEAQHTNTKDDAKSQVEEKKPETSAEKNTLNQEIKKPSTNEEKLNTSDKNDKTKNVKSEQNSIKADIKILTNSEVSEEKNEESIKKLVDKLVDIVVNAAKDIFDKKNGKEVTAEDLKDTVNKLVETKINKLGNEDNLKKLITQKLDIVENSIKKIKNEIKEVSIDKNTDVKNLPVDLKENIKTEVKNIKTEVKNIKAEVKNIKTEVKNSEENELETKDENDNPKKEIKTENTEKIIDNVDKNEDKSNIKKENSTVKSNNDTKTISESSISKILNTNLTEVDDKSDEIEVLISKITTNDSKIETPKKELAEITEKIEQKTESIKEAIVDIKEKVSDILIVTTSNKEVKNVDSQNKNQIINEKNTSSDTLKESSEKPLLASMFLNAQKTAKNTNSLEQVKDAKENILDKKTVESVKKSAEKLDLNLDDTEINHEEEKGIKPVSQEKKDELRTNNLIDNRSLNKAVITQKINNNSLPEENAMVSKITSSTNSEVDKKNISSVEMIVPKEIIPTLQNKIIGAQQKVGQFMNDVARNMYLNYKPPVTAFRVNLNPANLGSISVIMKANKIDNSLSVSMNLSNSNTMEAFTENKAVLQNAIQRQFNESSNVSINFNMQEQGSENQFEQNNQEKNQNNQEQNQENDSEINELDEKEIVTNNDYM